MKLKEQIRPHARYWDCYNDEPELYNHTGKLVKIADKFAIEFAKWYHSANNNEYHLYPTKNIEEHLQIFKKEKEL